MPGVQKHPVRKNIKYERNKKMAGMTKEMLSVIEYLSKNQIQKAKEAAIVCCESDTTAKNAVNVNYYKKLLKNGHLNMFEVPVNMKGLINMQDMSDFRENRYYVGHVQEVLMKRIETGVKVTEKMLAYGIPYLNSTLIYGEPGTGKTEFAKYAAYKLKLPFVYVNFSQLISSYLGDMSKNLQRIFDYCKGQKCVLFLDEIDCIGLARGHGNDSGADGELARTTISLMQCLDSLVDGQVVLAATNRADRLDTALLRRFRYRVEFSIYTPDEAVEMAQKFIDTIDVLEMDSETLEFAKSGHTQAEISNYLIDKLARKVAEAMEEVQSEGDIKE